MSKIVTLIGATGLIGNHLYELLKGDSSIDRIRLIVRRPIDKDDPRTEIKLVDFNDPESFMLAIDGSDVIFCAVGTTQQKVKGDQQAYRKVDHDIPVNAARYAKMLGCETFVLVSSVGADIKSRNFYLRLKGEVENAVKAVGLKTVHIMRPSILTGNRKEPRAGEAVAKTVMKALSVFLPSRYKPVHAKTVAKAMIAAARRKEEGFFIYENREMRRLTDEP